MQNIAFLNTLGQVQRTIDLPLMVGGDFNLGGDVLEQSGWLHAVRARIAAPSNDTPTGLDSTGKGKVIDFFVISEELHPFVKTVAVDEKPTVIRTHRPVVLTLEGVKRERLVHTLRRPASLPTTAPVGPSRRPRVTLMLSECGQQEHSDAVVRATLDEAARPWGRTVEPEVLGRYDFVDEGVCNDHHCFVTQSDGRMETHWALHRCAAGLLAMDSQSSDVKLGAIFLQALLVRVRLRTPANTRLGGSAWWANSSLLWVSRRPRHSLTLPWRSSTSSTATCGERGLRLLRFLIGLYGGPRLL